MTEEATISDQAIVFKRGLYHIYGRAFTEQEIRTIQGLIRDCQARVAEYHTRGWVADQQGDIKRADGWYRLSRGQNDLLQKYWEIGGERILQVCLPESNHP